MNQFFNEEKNILVNFFNQKTDHICINGINAEVLHLLFKNFFLKLIENKKNVFVFSNNDEAETFHDYFNNFSFYPGLEISPYLGMIPSEDEFNQRNKILANLSKNQKAGNICTTLEAIFLTVPAPVNFNTEKFSLKTSDIISPQDLAKKLSSIGYYSMITTEEEGTFFIKGEIVDLNIINGRHVRILYFDDMIEHIFEISNDNLQTNKAVSFETIEINPAPKIITNPEYVTNLRNELPRPLQPIKKILEERNQFFAKILEGVLPENYPFIYPFFFKEKSTLYLELKRSDYTFWFFDLEKIEKKFFHFFEEITEDHKQVDHNTYQYMPEPNQIYTINSQISKNRYVDFSPLNIKTKNIVDFKAVSISNFLIDHQQFYSIESKHEYTNKLASFIINDYSANNPVYIFYQSTSAYQEIIEIFKDKGKNSNLKNINFIKDELHQGIYFKKENLLFLSESDFFHSEKKKTKRQKAKPAGLDLFADQLASLKLNDFVIHSDHGVGIYRGLQSIQSGSTSDDFLVIEYEHGDKIYLPVYRMNLVQKYSDANSVVKISNLQTKKFDQAKKKARESAKELAFDLIKLTAERKLKKSFQFSPPDHLFKEFELAFAYSETPDQMKAINDVVEDLQKTYPMDRLICGDVGFGKTEVAMRAAMKAVIDKKQVAILVPTTILALQHYNSFIERFKNFPVNIDFISRFKSSTEIKKVHEKISEGKIDIVIGTHSLLSKNLRFLDLGLLIIDEEHRFGVAHKEQLKLLKSNVHILTLSATPIPRTLQLSFMGLRDLSIIQTPPPKRQSIKTFLVYQEEQTIKKAIEKELLRGGQVYYVHNRVNDIEEVLISIQKLVPKAKILVAHGQLAERELEDRINQFYQGKYDILLATTIIESGIDIPRANTMIINRADTFGLAQLHQLRGRIGRSDRKAYAYFLIPPKVLSTNSENRLKALQTYSDLGSGFNLSNSDLEIRGAGDILGASQSGHIENIGLELYLELLNEAMAEIKGDQQLIKKDFEISVPFHAFIPHHYIADSSLRLKYYKKLSSTSSLEKLKILIDEISDIFGTIPKEINGLFKILTIKINLQSMGLESFKLSGKIITMQFDHDYMQKNVLYRDKVVDFFLQRPKQFKMSPNYSVTHELKTKSGSIEPEDLVVFSKFIADSLSLC